MFKDFNNFLEEMNIEYADCELEETYVYNVNDKIIGMQLFYYSEYSRDLLIEIIQCSMDDVRIYAEHDSDYTDKIFNSIESALSELKKYNFEFKKLDFKLVK